MSSDLTYSQLELRGGRDEAGRRIWRIDAVDAGGERSTVAAFAEMGAATKAVGRLQRQGFKVRFGGVAP